MVDIPSEDKKEIIRVSISEAARLFGVNTQTIRRAIKAGEITYIVVAGRYKVNFESLVRWSQTKTTVKHKTDKNGIGQYVDKWKIKNTLYSPSNKNLPPPAGGVPPKAGKPKSPPVAPATDTTAFNTKPHRA